MMLDVIAELRDVSTFAASILEMSGASGQNRPSLMYHSKLLPWKLEAVGVGIK